MIRTLLNKLKCSMRDNCDRYYVFKLFGFGVFLHRIHHDEEPDLFHNHPWPWISVVFGSYGEERVEVARPGYTSSQKRRIRFLNWARAKTYHRIELDRVGDEPKPTWTLFIHGRRSNQWNVINAVGEVVTSEPWRGVGGPTSYRGK